MSAGSAAPASPRCSTTSRRCTWSWTRRSAASRGSCSVTRWARSSRWPARSGTAPTSPAWRCPARSGRRRTSPTSSTALEEAVAAGAGEHALDALGAFNEAFEPARTKFDWLSRDPAEVDAYLADPLCGDQMPLTAAYAAGVFGLAVRCATPEALAQLPDGLPVLLLSGQRDPVGGDDAAQVTALAELLRARDLPVEQQIYADARHEVFNETNRDEVVADLMTWLDARLAAARAADRRCRACGQGFSVGGRTYDRSMTAGRRDTDSAEWPVFAPPRRLAPGPLGVVQAGDRADRPADRGRGAGAGGVRRRAAGVGRPCPG